MQYQTSAQYANAWDGGCLGVEVSVSSMKRQPNPVVGQAEIIFRYRNLPESLAEDNVHALNETVSAGQGETP